MGGERRKPGKRYFTVAEANRMLPLVRAVVGDITQLAQELTERQQRLRRLQGDDEDKQRPGDVYQEEIESIRAELDRGQERMGELVAELTQLGIELKDFFTGLIDFPCWMGNREVYLCWRHGEPEVGHWHELDAGFAGRQKIKGAELTAPSVTEK
jgi:hypothetical protein